jgi:hypothetical protein
MPAAATVFRRELFVYCDLFTFHSQIHFETGRDTMNIGFHFVAGGDSCVRQQNNRSALLHELSNRPHANVTGRDQHAS